MKKYVTDIIGEEYKEWECGSVVTIQAPTGSGKSYFIQNALYDSLGEDERILFLVNRTDLKMQFKIDMCNKLGIEPKNLETRANYGKLTIMSYQRLQERIRDKKYEESLIDLSQYKYIVCDEIHYLLSDSTFNNKTREIYECLIDTQLLTSTRIFITATMDSVGIVIDDTVKKLNLVKYDYKLDIDYSYVNPICFKTIGDIAMRIKNSENEKWIVFVTNKYQADTIINTATNKDCKFIYSTDKDDISNKSQEVKELRNYIVNNNRFDCDVLIATKVLENGVNLFMEDLHNIVIMDNDKSTFIQELGRLRVQEDQEVNLYIPCKSKKYFEDRLNSKDWTNKDKMLKKYKAAKTNKVLMNEFTKNYWDCDHKKLDDQLFYKEKGKDIEINRIGLYKYEIDKNFTEYMIQQYETCKDYEYHKFIYPMEVCGWLDIDSYNLYEDIIQDEVDEVVYSELEDFLRNANENEERFTKEYFRDTIDNIIKNDKELQIIMNRLDGRNTRKKGLNKYNEFFEELNYPYHVGSYPRYITIDGKRKKLTEWIVTKNDKQ